ncbi:MAG: UMP kinase [Methanomicrobiales archaeon]|nr:UMP kinase [Methanomicrobiales archaeon]MDI6877481.1 UMP kinase [Methanomicrobiales archaeon]
MKKIVLSLGGSVLIPSLESNNIGRFCGILRDIAASHRLYVVVGGGGEARRYIGAASRLGLDDASADEIGILVTRINAYLLIGALGDAVYPLVPEDYREAKAFGESAKIVVMGGVAPAQTTDAVSAVLAEYIGADVLINATSVDGIYSADPRKNAEAVRHARLTPRALLEIIREDRLTAGSNIVFDIVAAKVVERSGIPLVVIDGRDPDNLRRAVFAGDFTGTVVSDRDRAPLPL